MKVDSLKNYEKSRKRKKQNRKKYSNLSWQDTYQKEKKRTKDKLKEESTTKKRNQMTKVDRKNETVENVKFDKWNKKGE